MKTEARSRASRPNRPKARFLRNRWLFRLSLSFLLISVILTGLLMLLVSRTVTGQFIDQTDAANRELLAQTAINIDYTLTDLYNEYYQLWQKDPAIQAVLQASGTVLAPELDQELTQKLRFSADQLLLVRSAHLISYRYDRVWSSDAAPTDLASQPDTQADPFLKDLASQSNDYHKDVFFARTTRYAESVSQPALANRTVANLTFFFARRSTNPASRPFDDVLLVNVDRDAFSQLIQQQTDTGFILLVSPSGEIVSDTSSRWSGQELDAFFEQPDHFTRLSQAQAPGGSFLAATAAGRSLVTWQKASSMKFFLIDIMPLTSVYSEVNRLNRQIVFYFLAAMLLSLLIGLVSVRQLYKPLQNLLDRIAPAPLSAAGASPPGTARPDSGLTRPATGLARPDRSRATVIDEFAMLDEAYQNFAIREQQQIMLSLLQGLATETRLTMKNPVPSVMGDLANPAATAWLAITLMPVQEKGLSLDQTILLVQNAQDQLGQVMVVTHEEMINTLLPLTAEQTMATLRELYEQWLPVWQASGQPALVCGLGAPVEQLADAPVSHRQAVIAANQARLLASDQTTLAPQVIAYADFASARQPSGASPLTWASQAKALVEQQLADPNLSIDQIASAIGLSNGYLRQLFKQETGQTLNDYIIESRIRHACALLETTSQTGREIASATGFNDARYFYTLFKKRTGQTIEQYRRSKAQTP